MATQDEKLDIIVGAVSEIKTTLAVQQEILEEHQRRSEANEAGLSLLAEKLQPLQATDIVLRFLSKWAGIMIGGGLVTWGLQFLFSHWK